MRDGDGLQDTRFVLAGAWPLRRGAATTRSLSRVCTTFFLDAFALGTSLSVLPNLAEALRFEGSVEGPELVVLALVGALAPGTAGVAWTRLSARSGRRLTCLVSGLCRAFGLALMAVAASTGWLGAGVTLWGVGVGSLAISTDFVSDVVPRAQRPAALGLLVAAVALGLAAGANLGGLLPSDEPRLALWFCSPLSVVGVAYALTFLPESLARERRPRSVSAEERRWEDRASGRAQG